MTYARLLVHLDPGPDSDARVAQACDLACRLEARLLGVAASAPEPPVGDPFTAGAMMGEALTLLTDMAQRDVAVCAARFEEATRACAVQAEWGGATGDPVDVLMRAATRADLVITGRSADGRPTAGLHPADALMAVGRPVLMTPPGLRRAPLGAPAVVAWKTTRQAQRALADALPLLQRAAAVHVVEIAPDDGREAAATACAAALDFLAVHEVEATGHALEKQPGSTAMQLLDFAESVGAGLLVAGGYGHSRAREAALGGVTRTLIGQASICVLFSH